MTTVITTNYTLAAGQVVSGLNELVLRIEGSAWNNILLHGQVRLTVTVDTPLAAVGVQQGDSGARTIKIGPFGSVSIDAAASQGWVNGVGTEDIVGRVNLVNEGAISVRSAGEAQAVHAGAGGLTNSGSILADAVSNATGVRMSNGGPFINTGSITVTGGSAFFSSAQGVWLRQTSTQHEVVNAGTIRVLSQSTQFPGVGVDFAGFARLTNSGLIEADRALNFRRDDIQSGGGRMADVTNTSTGALRGEVHLSNETTEPVTLRNFGVIEGAVMLNNGADTFAGGSGYAAGVVRGGPGADMLIAGKGPTALLGEEGEDELTALYNSLSADGGAGNDLIRLTGVYLNDAARDTRLYGGDGDDVFQVTVLAGRRAVIDGGAGRNTLDMQHLDGPSPDPLVLRLDGLADPAAWSVTNVRAVSVANHAVSIFGGAADETFNASGSISAAAGNDTLAGLSGSNTLFGGDGSDSITGGAGFNQVNGNRGEDTIIGKSMVGDWLLGGQGSDRIEATQSGAHNIINGNIGADTIHGGAFGDTLRGGQDDDIIIGGAGGDWFSGDLGVNTLTGGAGADRFRGSAGRDVITDFSAGQGDRVEVAGGLTYAASQVGDDVRIDLSNGGQIILQQVQLAGLPAEWIVIV